MKDHSNPKKKITSKQVVAMAGVILLVAIYIITLLVAIFNPGESGNYFRICLVSTIAVPILIWIYVWMYGKLTNRHTFADPNYLKPEEPKED
ncbi:MAG: hypothetical protein IKK33_16740 [Lachnospiraceae bacterium]|nr:hypothetical protein [Lachnospiraceae bacterium]